MKILRFRIKTGLFNSSHIIRVNQTERLHKKLLKLANVNKDCDYILLECRKTKVLTSFIFIPVTSENIKDEKYNCYKQAWHNNNVRCGLMFSNNLEYSVCYSVISLY